MNLIERRNTEMVSYLSKYEVAVCTECHHVLNKSPGISRHLMSVHLWSKTEAKAIDEQFIDKTIRSPNHPNCTWILPKPEDPAIPYLSLHEEGYGCHLCAFVCRTQASIVNHYSIRHRDEVHSSPLKQLYRRNVHVQSFTKGANNQCFEVNRGNDNDSNTKTSSILPFNDIATQIRKQLHLQMQQRTNTVKESLSIIQKSQDYREVSPWLHRTKWITHLQGYDYRQIAKLVELPKKEEQVLTVICDAFKRAMFEAKQIITEQKLSQFDLKQINSFDRDKSFSRPLNMDIQDSTFNFYISVWQKLLCYLIRTTRPADPENLPPLLYQLTNVQKNTLTELVGYAAVCLMVPRFDVAYTLAIANLDKTCVAISIRLLDHALHGNEYESVVVSFLAASGIDPNKGVFKDVGVSTRDFSALIKVAQLLVIRYSIYEVEQGKVDYVSTAMEEMRTRFMTYDGRTPMGWIHSIRAYGKKLSANRTVDGDISWSDDLQKISYKGFECSLSNFRKFISILSKKGKDQLADLFLVGEGKTLVDVAPAVRLFAIKDNPKEAAAGWSFLKHEGNEHLFNGSTWIMDRITSHPKLFERFLEQKTEVVWRTKAVNEYLKTASDFLQTLFLLVHITSGQPARVKEELGIRYCNTMSGEHRNVFVDNGVVEIVIRYHKGYSMEGSTRITHRFLSKEISEMFVLYLWLILPFKQYLEAMRSATPSAAPSPLIWSPCNTSGKSKKKWDTERICKALEKESMEILKSKLQILIYRHVAIAMANKHIRDRFFHPISPEEDKI
jgi:Orsellinic acid/F9775 biosynthesis cluster protein D